MTTLEIIRLVATEFASVPDEVILQWAELAKPYVSKEKFGKLYDQALAYMICHLMKSSGLGIDALGDYAKMGASAGMAGISSLSDGGSSISFAWPNQTVTSAEMVFSGTIYGRMYLALLRLVIVPITIDH